MDGDLRAFYEYNSMHMEPWDGPAGIVMTEGRHAVCLLDDPLAQRGHLNGGFGAFEQGDAELVLEFLDGHRQRRLGNEAAFGGAAEVALLGQGYDVAEFC